MSNTAISASEDVRSRMRATVATIERALSSLSHPELAKLDVGGSQIQVLTSAWTDLVRQLDLGTAPERRECPVCHNFGMLKATVCGFCWTKFAPVT
ncbi:MAG TPA: hypothetical protein VIV60_22760 [Polyangiaceae bacterium]